MESLATFANQNHTLKYLDVSFNRIGDQGLIALANMIRQNEKLQVLNALGNEFTVKSSHILAQALQGNTKSSLTVFKMG